MGQASRLFNGNAEQTLYSRITPTTEQREFLQTQWNALAEHLKADLASCGYPISTWLQGSYKYGTLIKPVHLGEEYDVDVGVYFEWDPEETEVAPTPGQLRQWVQREIHTYKETNDALKVVEEPAKERCSRAVYVKQFHIDTPTYHLNTDTEERRLACLSGKWEDSDPKALYKWFKNVVSGDDRDQLRRIIRYLKGWAAVAFVGAPESRPSSIVLTVAAAEAYEGMWLARFGGIADDDALIAVVKKLYERLNEDRKVLNPIDSDEDLNRIATEAWAPFLTRLNILHDAAISADEAEDEAGAAFAWSEALSFLMPLPEIDEVEVLETSSGRALMVLPEIQVQVFNTANEQLIATFMNEVPGVERNRKLIFTIMNPHVVPDFGVVEWTVRNDGADAEQLGDLGHAQGGIGLISTVEHTAYIGKHYMDCVVRCNGSVYAARRIPVNIKPSGQQLLAKARTSWTRLRSRRGRR